MKIGDIIFLRAMTQERVPRPLPYGWTGKIIGMDGDAISFTMEAERYFEDPNPIKLEFIRMPDDLFHYGGTLYRYEEDMIQLGVGQRVKR